MNGEATGQGFGLASAANFKVQDLWIGPILSSGNPLPAQYSLDVPVDMIFRTLWFGFMADDPASNFAIRGEVNFMRNSELIESMPFSIGYSARLNGVNSWTCNNQEVPESIAVYRDWIGSTPGAYNPLYLKPFRFRAEINKIIINVKDGVNGFSLQYFGFLRCKSENIW